MIQTVDFFTPIVDDPYTFGQIAAANSLSDVYAMGGEPKVALNIVGFPNCLDPEILGEILRGGADKVKEARAVLVGGHSVQDKIYKNYGCQPGDALILTKQIGSGIITTAVKGGMASVQAEKEVITVMASLNQKAAEAAKGFTVHACTDITGFGLLGHCAEMASASDVTLEIHVEDVAYMEDAPGYAKMGLVPAGAYKNREHSGEFVDMGSVDEYYTDMLYDPQTSGGLLFSIPQNELGEFLAELTDKKLDTKVSVIGRVLEKSDKLIRLMP